ncbi:Peroxidase [Thalictrum thalictroides]|uniref:Peroxidase n=1 Tax=Thalictrum thalictroides TaxID=46969 RepID=A0A7J6V652_THATH|nr:Peroxidase [Thalictrum thalictroides]
MTTYNNLVLLGFSLILVLPFLSNAQLSDSFYTKTCPSVLDIVKSNVRSAINRDKRMGASLLRLFFHDCFVSGCDAGVLLDDNLPTIDSEKNARPNRNSIRGFELIDKIKDAVDKACPGPIVSCSDILAITARDSVVELGGPSWSVLLGRRDARTANRNDAENLPSPFADLPELIKNFSDKGFTAKEMVVLSGAHSVGVARCVLFRDHLYNGTNIENLVATARKSKCPSNGQDDNLSSMDHQSPNRFGNNYFQALVNRRGLLHSDQELFNGGSTDDMVRVYSKDSDKFYTDFANAMIKLGNVKPLTLAQGEIRKNCRKLN